MRVAGDWVNNGIFNHNNGTVVFNGNTTVSGTKSNSFNHFTVWGLFTAPTSSLYVAGNWVNDGTFTHNNGTIVFNGLPPGDFPAPIFDVVLKGLTIRGSIVGTRQDMIEALDFYARGLVKPKCAVRELDDINAVFEEMQQGKIDGRIVIRY